MSCLSRQVISAPLRNRFPARLQLDLRRQLQLVNAAGPLLARPTLLKVVPPARLAPSLLLIERVLLEAEIRLVLHSRYLWHRQTKFTPL